MFKPDLIFQARWDQLYLLFMSGTPPLVVQLLAINTIFLVYFAIRRVKAKGQSKHKSAYVLQGLLIAANVFVVFNEQFMGMAHSTRAMMRF